MEFREQGFEQNQQNHLNSKELTKQRAQQNLYFVVPDAKPILPKNYVDMNKPKVLIKQINFTKEPIELLFGRYMRDQQTNESIVSQIKKTEILVQNTIWSKYILSQNYICLYLKYYKDNLNELMKKGHKKMKAQIHKISQYSQYVFSTYFIDLSFLADVGLYLLRNLQQIRIRELYQLNKYQNDNDIIFDSKFECGNLFSVFKKNNTDGIDEYDLLLQTDVNTKGYSHWFYFSFKSVKKRKFRFNIVNMQRNHSLFASGMRVACFSLKKFENEKLQWHRDGYDYSYSRNQLIKGLQTPQKFHTLSFSIDQKYDDDLIYISMNYPYSYSKLLRYIQSVEKVAKLNSHIYVKKDYLGKTISSNLCPILTLTWKRDKKNQQTYGRKKIIGVIARQHPCQSVSSFVMEGFINSLLYIKNEYSVQLLKRYIFKIIPMMNIDGVVYGNSRCDISGTDINRRWMKNPNASLYPIVASVKSVFQRLSMQGYEIQYFFDLHGHSKRLGSFIYGCKTFDDYQNKQFSWIMSKLNNKFTFQECSYGVSNFKKQTARAAMSAIVLNKKSMTLQTSFYGYKTGNGIKHFEVKDLYQLGENLLQSIYVEQFKSHKSLNWQNMLTELKKFLAQENFKQKDKGSESSGSDSNPSVDEMTQKQMNQTFLPSQIAKKIGLIETKVIQRIKDIRKPSEEIKQTFQEIETHDQDNLNSIFQQKNSQILQRYSQGQKNQKPIALRQSKSVTKIAPFKFTQRSKKSSSQLKPKIRIAIDIYHKNPPTKQIPKMPLIIQQKNKFWQQFNKQFQSLMLQRHSGMIARNTSSRLEGIQK